MTKDELADAIEAAANEAPIWKEGDGNIGRIWDEDDDDEITETLAAFLDNTYLRGNTARRIVRRVAEHVADVLSARAQDLA